jgi:hypothetical protein
VRRAWKRDDTAAVTLPVQVTSKNHSAFAAKRPPPLAPPLNTVILCVTSCKSTQYDSPEAQGTASSPHHTPRSEALVTDGLEHSLMRRGYNETLGSTVECTAIYRVF